MYPGHAFLFSCVLSLVFPTTMGRLPSQNPPNRGPPAGPEARTSGAPSEIRENERTPRRSDGNIQQTSNLFPLNGCGCQNQWYHFGIGEFSTNRIIEPVFGWIGCSLGLSDLDFEKPMAK